MKPLAERIGAAVPGKPFPGDWEVIIRIVVQDGLPAETSPVAMSFHLAIPWQVALLQSLPPLHQPAPILQERAFGLQRNSSER
jgi:hypothetical protein